MVRFSRRSHLLLPDDRRSEEHTSELQSRSDLVCRLLLEKKKNTLLLMDFGALWRTVSTARFSDSLPMQIITDLLCRAKFCCTCCFTLAPRVIPMCGNGQ